MNAPLIRGYEVVIGLETHAQLSTTAKIFSGAPTAFGAAPNTQAAPLDLALPGTLPVMNRGAVERAIQFGLAVGGAVAPRSIFARKNYFYPDLPKGYQISQYENPVVQGGAIDFLLDGQARRVRLTRAHLEEDAGKSVHGAVEGFSGIDLNRAGTPLLEIVSEPEMRSAAEAVAYAKALHTLVVWLGLCDGNMQEGSFRCDANVSIRRPGAPFGTRREIKNLNSFRFLQLAIDAEVQWQIERQEDGLPIQQATVLFDPDANGGRGETRSMRTKEDAHDYRYFPDPDLPPLVIGADWIERVRAAMPELPGVMAARFQREDGLPAYDAAMVTQSLPFARYYEAARDACKALAAGRDATGVPKLVANWLMGEVSKRLNSEGLEIDDAPVSPLQLGWLISKIQSGFIASNTAARQIFDQIWREPLSPKFTGESMEEAGRRLTAFVEMRGLASMSNAGELEAILDAVLAANAKSVEEFRAGKDKAFNALVGQAMKATRGKANPGLVNELLKKKLAG